MNTNTVPFGDCNIGDENPKETGIITGESFTIGLRAIYVLLCHIYCRMFKNTHSSKDWYTENNELFVNFREYLRELLPYSNDCCDDFPSNKNLLTLCFCDDCKDENIRYSGCYDWEDYCKTDGMFVRELDPEEVLAYHKYCFGHYYIYRDINFTIPLRKLPYLVDKLNHFGELIPSGNIIYKKYKIIPGHCESCSPDIEEEICVTKDNDIDGFMVNSDSVIFHN